MARGGPIGHDEGGLVEHGEEGLVGHDEGEVVTGQAEGGIDCM